MVIHFFGGIGIRVIDFPMFSCMGYKREYINFWSSLFVRRNQPLVNIFFGVRPVLAPLLSSVSPLLTMYSRGVNRSGYSRWFSCGIRYNILIHISIHAPSMPSMQRSRQGYGVEVCKGAYGPQSQQRTHRGQQRHQHSTGSEKGVCRRRNRRNRRRSISSHE